MWFDAPVRLYISDKDISTDPISDLWIEVKGDITYGEFLHITSMRTHAVQEYVDKGKVSLGIFQNEILLDIGISGWSLGEPYSSNHLKMLPYPVVFKIIGFMEKHFWISDRSVLDEYTQVVEKTLRGAYQTELRVYQNPKHFERLPPKDQEFLVKKVSEYLKYQDVINIATLCIHTEGFGAVNVGVLPYAGGILDQPSKLWRMILIYRDLLIDKIKREKDRK